MTDHTHPRPAAGSPVDCDVGRLEPERAAFEAWFSEAGKWPAAVRRSGDGYALASAQSAWSAWQAAWLRAINYAHPFRRQEP